MYIDLHTHSTCSDGTYTPREIADTVIKKGITPFSITDHDNIAAYNEDLPIDEDIVLIPGVEISAEFSKGTLHILGYGIDPTHEQLRETLEELLTFRLNRNRNMLAKMDVLGWDITMEELIAEAKGEVIGRPHFANLMYRKGYVSSYQEAFDRYLAKGAPLYLDKKRLSPQDSIDLITKAGGIPVMAHPYQTKREGEELEVLVKELKEMGLQGMEAFYSQHTPQMTQQYLDMAEKYGLSVTAGSDFHGANKPDIELGMEVSAQRLRPFFKQIADSKYITDKNREKLAEYIFRSVGS